MISAGLRSATRADRRAHHALVSDAPDPHDPDGHLRAALESMREQATEVDGPASNVASFLIELSNALDEAITTAERHRD